MFRRMIYSMILAMPLLAGAADLTTKSGRFYKDYEVSGANSKGIVIFHASGTATIDPADWPDDKKAEIGKQTAQYEKLSSAAEQKSAKAAEDRLLNQSNTLVLGRVLSVTSNGILVSGRLPHWVDNDTLSVDDKIKTVAKNPAQKTLFDKIYSEESKRIGTHDEKGKAWSQAASLKRLNNELKKQNSIKWGEICFIEINPAGYTDDQEISDYYYRVGSYQYNTVNGASKTVPKYTADRKTALEYLSPKK